MTWPSSGGAALPCDRAALVLAARSPPGEEEVMTVPARSPTAAALAQQQRGDSRVPGRGNPRGSVNGCKRAGGISHSAAIHDHAVTPWQNRGYAANDISGVLPTGVRDGWEVSAESFAFLGTAPARMVL